MQRTSMLGEPCLMQSERPQSTASVVSALLSRLVISARVPVLKGYRMQGPVPPQLLAWR